MVVLLPNFFLASAKSFSNVCRASWLDKNRTKFSIPSLQKKQTKENKQNKTVNNFWHKIYGECIKVLSLLRQRFTWCWSSPIWSQPYQKYLGKTLTRFGYFLFDTKHKCSQIYIKLTLLKDNDSRKLPLKYYLLRCCSFWGMSKTM